MPTYTYEVMGEQSHPDNFMRLIAEQLVNGMVEFDSVRTNTDELSRRRSDELPVIHLKLEIASIERDAGVPFVLLQDREARALYRVDLTNPVKVTAVSI